MNDPAPAEPARKAPASVDPGLDRRRFLRLAGAVAFSPLATGCGGDGGTRSGVGSGSDSGVTEQGSEAAGTVTPSDPSLVTGTWPVYDDSIVVDGLAGPIQFNIPQESLPLGPAALDHVRASGITAVNLTVNGRGSEGRSAYDATLERIAGWEAEAAAHPAILTIARTVEDLRACQVDGRLGLVLGFQDTVPFGDDLQRVDDFLERGVRIVQLTYNVANAVGVGCLVPDDTGLTPFGREVVARLDTLGVLVDLSHCGPRTTREGIRTSAGPVSITHTGCAAVYPHPRSKDDATLRLLADRGGVVGIYLMPFLNPAGPPTAEDVLRHLEHALDVCGEDHVGIGSDQGIVPLDVGGDFRTRFDEVSASRSAAGIAAPREDTIPYVPELNHSRRMEAIAAMMASRGHSTRVVEKVLGDNFMRLFQEVWT